MIIRFVKGELKKYIVNDMYAESRNDDYKYRVVATQEEFDWF